MKKIKLFCSVLFLGLITKNANAQMAGTYSVPATYSTIAAAISDLNTLGVSAPVTILIDAGYTETAPVGGYTLTATGTSANPVIFQKNGAGSNPQIMAYSGGTATPSSALQDGIWRFVGSDYVTVDGIDLFDANASNPATMEFGYGFFKASATDGCQNNTIKNCNILLSINNNATGTAPAVDGSRGIDMVNALFTAHTTNLVPTSFSGSNSNNKFYSNTIQNCNIGIALIGFAAASPFTLADTGNDIGGLASSTGNTIINFGGGSGATNPAAAIRTLAQYNINVSYNNINNNNGSGINHPATLRGIYLNTATSANVSVTNNTLTVSGGATGSQVSIIENLSGATASNNTVSISNNLITGCNNSITTTGIFYGIYNTASAAYLNIINNTFSNNSTNATTGATYLIYNTGSIGSVNNITGNNLSYAYNNLSLAYSGTMYNIYNAGSTLTTTLNISSNNFSNYNHNMAGTGTVYFIYSGSSSSKLTLSNNTWTGLTMNHSGTEYLMYNLSSTQNSLSVTGNSIVTAYNRVAAAGSMYFYYASASSLGTSFQTVSNNLVANVNAPVSGSGSFYSFYMSDGGTSPYPKKTITNNLVSNINYNSTGTFYGLYVPYLGDGNTTSGSSVFNNTITNVSWGGTIYGIYGATPYSPTYAPNVYSNHINNLTSSGAGSSMYGSYLSVSSLPGFNYYKNKIYNITENGATGSAHGIYVASCNNTNIYNNLIGAVSTPSSTGLNRTNGVYISAGTSVNLFYNTVYLNATSTGANFGSNAIYASTTPNVNLRNNIFVNNSTPTGTEFATAYRRSSSTITSYSTTSNNNLFYTGTPGANNLIFYDGTTPAQTLSAFKTMVMPMDGSSVTENPPFISTVGANANYLDLNTGIATQIESGAAPIASVTDDYAGTIRNAGTPDVGAWEGNYTAAPDMLPPSIVSAGFTGPACNVASRTYTATLTDFSGVASGSLSPRVYYKINGGAYASVPGTLTSGTANNGVWSFNLTYAGATFDVISYFLVAQDIVSPSNMVAVPGTGFTGTDVNNVTTPPTNPFSYIIGSLNGVYTVGVAGTFTSLTQAANAYNNMCLSGPVTFSLINSTYSSATGETFPILFTNNPDASATNSLLIIPASGNSVAVTGTTTSSVIKFLNARFITIDGLNTGGSALTINNPNTATSADIWLASTASTGPGNNNIGINNLTINGGSNTGTNYGIIAGVDGVSPSTTAGMDNDNITIQGNSIYRNWHGIYANGTTSVTSGGLNNWTIANNSIGPVTTSSLNIGYQGVYLQNATGVAVINNTISNVRGTSAYVWGINLNTGVNSATVNLNTITSIKYTGTSGYGGLGIDVNTNNNSSNITIQNNMISDITGDGWSSFTAGGFAGIRIAQSQATGGLKIQNNSISLNQANTIAGSSQANLSAAIYCGPNSSAMDIRNNILYSDVQFSTNLASRTYAIYSATTAAAFTNIDYNNYYVAGSQGTLALISAASQTNLAMIQSSFGGNMNSQTIAPVFVSLNDLHLPPPSNVSLDNLGTPIAGITVDIDGTTRNVTTPDIGADEYTPVVCTAANGGTLSSASFNICDQQTVALVSNSVSTGVGESYQWMVSNTAGGPYSPVTSGTGSATASYTTAALTPTVYYFVLQATCSSASLTGVSNEATVTVNSNPTVAVSPSTGTVCFPGGASVPLSASGASTYTWLPIAGLTATTGANVNALPAASVIYTVTGSNAAGCIATANASISAQEGPSIVMVSASPSLVCAAGNSSLNALGGLTSSYTISNITYSAIPTPSTGVTTLCSNGTTVIPLTQGSLDDGQWANFNFPFSFNFFGAGYSNFAISTNGFIWLGSGNPNTYFGYGTAFPSTTPARPVIGAVYADLDFDGIGSGSTIQYFVSGSSPNQKLVINWTGQFFPNTGSVTTQAVLYETSNIIEVHTFTSSANNSAVEGIQNAAGTSAYVVTGRNAVTWPVTTPDAYQWSPNGGPVSYSWTPSTFLSSTSISNPVAGSVTSAISYSVVMTATNGCSNTGTVSLSVDPGPTVTAVASPTMLCLPGSTTALTANGATTYSWSTGAITSTTIDSPTITTTYSVVGTSTAGCSSTATVAVTVGGAPSVTATATSGTVCAGGSTPLNASGATTYTWNTGATGNIIAVTPSVSTTYTVTGDNGGGCTGTGTVSVMVNQLPTVSIVPAQTTVCVNGPTVGLTGSPLGGVYTGANVSGPVFTPGSGTGTFTPGYAFTNTVTGCSNSATTTIVVTICTDISKQSSLKGLQVYPNPNRGEFIIELGNGSDKVVEVMDLTGRIVLSDVSANDKLNINIASLANGVYFVKVKSNNALEIIKIVKQ